jgi:hypothetical protein
MPLQDGRFSLLQPIPQNMTVGKTGCAIFSSATVVRPKVLAGTKVKVTLRPTISRPVRLGVRRPSGTLHQFFFLLKIFF